MKKYNTIARVTKKCYFQVRIGKSDAGRITIGLFGSIVPIAVRNFIELCSGDHGLSQISRKPLSYQNTRFHHIFKDLLVTGGDITL